MNPQPRSRRPRGAAHLLATVALTASLAAPGLASARGWSLEGTPPILLTVHLAPSRGEAWEMTFECNNANAPGLLHFSAVDTAGPDTTLGEDLRDRQGRQAPTRDVPGRVSAGGVSASAPMHMTYSPSVRGRMIMFDGGVPVASPTTAAFRRTGAISVTVNGRTFTPPAVPPSLLQRFSATCSLFRQGRP